MQQPPQYQQQQYNQPLPPARRSMKNLAIWMFVISWVCGFMGGIFVLFFITICLGVPLIIVAFTTHILGFIFLAQIQEV